MRKFDWIVILVGCFCLYQSNCFKEVTDVPVNTNYLLTGMVILAVYACVKFSQAGKGE